MKETIQEVYQRISKEENKGALATYIPELGNINPDNFGVYLSNIDKSCFGVGDFNEKFSIQSISKVLALSMAFQVEGEKIWERVGVEPSGTPFNSLLQLEADNGIPRNPFINAGAIVIADILLSNLDNPKEDFLAFVRGVCGNNEINYSSKVIESEKSVGYRNVALCNFIKSLGNIHNNASEVLDFYFSLCSIEMSCKELSEAFLFLANNGRKISTNEQILSKSATKRLNALMLTCGFYDESGEFAFKVGLPGKSGVGGGIIAIYPNKYAIAVWSPKLNEKGNSYRGMQFLEAFTTETTLSIF